MKLSNAIGNNSQLVFAEIPNSNFSNSNNYNNIHWTLYTNILQNAGIEIRKETAGYFCSDQVM